MMNFYVFLDIDNTMWNREDSNKYNIHDYRVDQSISKESADALNYLMLGLQYANYNPILVITSGDRKNWEQCKAKLYNAGVDDSFTITKLPINHRLGRWERIGVMLHDDVKGRKDKILSGERKYTFLDSFFFNYYKKNRNYVSIEASCNLAMNMSINNTIFIASGDKLTMGKVDLFFARNCIDASEKLQSKYIANVENTQNKRGRKRTKSIAYFDFLKQEYKEFKAERKRQKEHVMEEYIDTIKGISQINKRIKFKLKKFGKKPEYNPTNNQSTTKAKEDYALVPVEEESYFDFER